PSFPTRRSSDLGPREDCGTGVRPPDRGAGGADGGPVGVQAAARRSRAQDHDQGLRQGPPATNDERLPCRPEMTTTILINGQPSDGGIPVTESSVVRGPAVFE